MIKSKLLSIQFSKSDKEAKSKADQEAINNKLSIIDFSSCENYLDNGYLAKNESILFSKTDWNAALRPNNSNMTATRSPSVSYELYASNGTKIDTSLCSNTYTDIKVPLKNYGALNSTNLTYDPFNPNSDYFNDICMPLKKNDLAATINGRRKDFKGLNLTCSGGCSYGKVNTSTGYLSCQCNTSSTEEAIFPNFETAIMKALNQTNIFIAKCYKTAFQLVRLNFNCSLIFMTIWDLWRLWL